MGSTEVPAQSSEIIKVPTSHYDFGANFLDLELMLVGRIMTNGRMSARVKCDLTDNLIMKVNAQLTNEPHYSQGMFNFDYKRMANGMEHEEGLDDVLTAEERNQLDSALKMGSLEEEEEEVNGGMDSMDSSESNGAMKERKSWFGWNNKRVSITNGEDAEDPKKFSKLASENGNAKEEPVDVKKGKEKSTGKKKKNRVTGDSNKHESEYKKGLRPVLWLTPGFPLKTEELLPLLDVLANKVMAVRRLRELLTTKLPQGTFPIKVDAVIDKVIEEARTGEIGDGKIFCHDLS